MGLVVYNVAWPEAYLCTKWCLDPSSRLATIDMGRKLGVVPQTDRQDRQHRANRFTNGRPKMPEPIDFPFGLWFCGLGWAEGSTS